MEKRELLDNKVKKTRDLISKSFKIEVNIRLPSIYHFYLYEFKKDVDKNKEIKVSH